MRDGEEVEFLWSNEASSKLFGRRATPLYLLELTSQDGRAYDESSQVKLRECREHIDKDSHLPRWSMGRDYIMLKWRYHNRYPTYVPWNIYEETMPMTTLRMPLLSVV